MLSKTADGMEYELQPGDWVRFTLIDHKNEQSGPPAWLVRVEGDTILGQATDRPAPGRAKLSSIQLLHRWSDDAPPTPLSSGSLISAADGHLGRRLRRRYSLKGIATAKSVSAATDELKVKPSSTLAVEALDVGQASFNVIKDAANNEHVAYFDAGRPIWFHLHNLPQNFAPSISPNAIVILSHWDSDHYGYGLTSSQLQSIAWFAPEQTSVGPNAHRLARKLALIKKLNLVRSGRAGRVGSPLRLLKCTGLDINGSGLALHITSNGRQVLLPGDADYNVIPQLARMRLDGLVLPHHGAKLCQAGPVPTPASAHCQAIASFGRPNRYGHPSFATLLMHARKGWKIAATAGYPKRPRGNRIA